MVAVSYTHLRINENSIMEDIFERLYDMTAFSNIIAEPQFLICLLYTSTLAKGKKSVLMNELGPQLGQNMIACVDSAYDYLLQGCLLYTSMLE